MTDRLLFTSVRFFNKNNNTIMIHKYYHLFPLKAFAYLEVSIATLLLSISIISLFPLQKQAIADILFASVLTEAQLCLRNMWLTEKLQLPDIGNVDLPYCQPRLPNAAIQQDATHYCLQWRYPKHQRVYSTCIKK